MTLKKTPYNTKKLLSSGENASVYQAIERATGKKIALKVSKPGYERIIQQEGLLTQKIANKIPYVRRVVNLGQMPRGESYVAYEFVEQTLATYLKERRKKNKPFTLSEASEILMPIAQALDQLHYHFKRAHSDLKPDNILIGEEGTVRLADFGNATPFGKTAQQVSPFYMTPEQANNQPCQPASDVYGLALILYEMLTLSRPILGDNPIVMSIQVLNQQPIPIQNLRPDIKPRLAQNIMSGLQKAPTARPKQASALMTGFPPPKIKYGPPISPPPTMTKAQSGKKKSQKWPLLLLLALLLLFIFGSSGYLLGLFDNFSEEPTIVKESGIEEASVSPEPVDPSVTSSRTVEEEEEEEKEEEEEEEEEEEHEEAEAEEATGEEEPTEESISNGEATATRRPTGTSTRRPTATNTAPPTATSSTALATATSSTALATATSSTALATATSSTALATATSSTALATATSTVLSSLTPTLLVTPTSVPEITNTVPNTGDPTLLAEEATITVAPTFTIINSTPSPTIAPATVAPSATIPPTAVVLPTSTPPPTAPPATSTVAPQPTTPPSSPTITATKPPPTPANYNQTPELISPSNGEVIQFDTVTFKWNWNGPSLAQGQQFRLHGFRDGEWLELNRSTTTTADVVMRGKGNFETNWEWYVVVIDQTGKEISPRSSTESFGISLPNN